MRVPGMKAVQMASIGNTPLLVARAQSRESVLQKCYNVQWTAQLHTEHWTFSLKTCC